MDPEEVSAEEPALVEETAEGAAVDQPTATADAAEGGDADAAAAAAAPAVPEEPPVPCRVLPEPLILGPKTFTTSDQCFKYFSAVLAHQTMHQNCNEARICCADVCRLRRARGG